MKYMLCGFFSWIHYLVEQGHAENARKLNNTVSFFWLNNQSTAYWDDKDDDDYKCKQNDYNEISLPTWD